MTSCSVTLTLGPDASPTESGHGDRAAPPAVAEAPCLITTVPRSARNGAGLVQIKTSGTPRVPAAGPSTRRLPSTRFPTTRGRRLTDRPTWPQLCEVASKNVLFEPQCANSAWPHHASACRSVPARADNARRASWQHQASVLVCLSLKFPSGPAH